MCDGQFAYDTEPGQELASRWHMSLILTSINPSALVHGRGGLWSGLHPNILPHSRTPPPPTLLSTSP